MNSILGLVAILLGIGSLTAAPPVAEGLQKLAVPTYYLPYFGTAKILGALGLFSTHVVKTDVFREGAQWGLFLYLLGATATHVLAGDLPGMVSPTVLTGLALASLVVFQKQRNLH